MGRRAPACAVTPAPTHCKNELTVFPPAFTPLCCWGGGGSAQVRGTPPARPLYSSPYRGTLVSCHDCHHLRPSLHRGASPREPAAGAAALCPGQRLDRRRICGPRGQRGQGPPRGSGPLGGGCYPPRRGLREPMVGPHACLPPLIVASCGGADSSPTAPTATQTVTSLSVVAACAAGVTAYHIFRKENQSGSKRSARAWDAAHPREA